MNNASNQQNKYIETKIQTASRDQLLMMLYDGAIRYCKAAIEGIRHKNHALAHQSIIKVQDIVLELTITLDRKSEVAGPLLLLYEYFIHRLIEANQKKEAAPAEEVLQHLIGLKETWVKVVLSLRNQNSL